MEEIGAGTVTSQPAPTGGVNSTLGSTAIPLPMPAPNENTSLNAPGQTTYTPGTTNTAAEFGGGAKV